MDTSAGETLRAEGIESASRANQLLSIAGGVAGIAQQFSIRSKEADIVDSNVRADGKLIKLTGDLLRLSKEEITPEQYQERARELTEASMEGEDSATFRTKFSAGARTRTEAGLIDFFNRDHKRKVERAATTMNDGAEDVANRVADFFGDPDASNQEKSFILLLAMEELEELTKSGKGLTGEKAMNDFKSEATKAMLGAAIDGMMVSDPEGIERFLDSEFVKKQLLTTMDGDELKEVRARAADRAAKRQKMIAIGTASRQHANGSRMIQEILNGTKNERDIAIQEAQGDISSSQATVYRRLASSPRTQNVKDDIETFIRLDATLAALPKLIDKEGNVIETDELMLLERFAVFQSDVAQAVDAGKLSVPTARRMIESTSISAGETIREVIENLKPVTIANHWWRPNIITPSFSETESVAAASAFQNELFRRIKIERQKLAPGAKLSMRKMRAIVSELKDNFVLSEETDEGIYELGKVYDLNDGHGKFRITGFDSEGNAITSPDLKAPVNFSFEQQKK